MGARYRCAVPDRPTDTPGPPSGGDPEKTLHDLLAALSNVGDDRGAEPSRPASTADAGFGTSPAAPAATATSGDLSPVAELRAALEQLFDLIRAERAGQRAEIAELEAALAQANARIRQLESGQRLEAPAPPPNDFNQLREAAERLRQRTQELFRDAGAPTTAETPPEDGIPAAEIEPTESQEDEPAVAEIASIEPFAKPSVLRVFPAGPDASEPDEPSLEVENELAVEAVAEPPAPAAPEAPASPEDDLGETVDDELTISADLPIAVELPVEDELPDAADEAAESEAPSTPAAQTPRAEPIEVAPRPARKRRAGIRRRRIDARKLEGVDPATALRAMVTAIDDIWTANVTLDLAVALTDGGTLKVTGGHNRPLNVGWVEPGTPARTTITATTAQLVPLFGRLELTNEQSAPLIHGPRRDADLLVGWIDRAQRLSPEPL